MRMDDHLLVVTKPIAVPKFFSGASTRRSPTLGKSANRLKSSHTIVNAARVRAIVRMRRRKAKGFFEGLRARQHDRADSCLQHRDGCIFAVRRCVRDGLHEAGKIGRGLADDPDVVHVRCAVGMLQIARLFEIVRSVSLASEQAEPRRRRMADERERKAKRDLLPVGQLGLPREIERRIGVQPCRAPRGDVGARILRIEHQHREAVVAFEIIAVERGEGEMPAAMLGHVLWRRDCKQLEKAAAQLNDGIAGAERMLAARRHRKSQPRVMRSHGLKIAAGKHQVVDGFH
jgi:hypothetical protein